MDHAGCQISLPNGLALRHRPLYLSFCSLFSCTFSIASVYQWRITIRRHFCLALGNFGWGYVSNTWKTKTTLSLVPQVWLGLASSRNVCLWCYDLNSGGPFDPSPEFVGHGVFVNRKHSCTSRGKKLQHILPPVWPLNSCHLLQTLPRREG